MATKAEKRRAGEARQAQHRHESIQSGLRAQRRDRERRELAMKKREEADMLATQKRMENKKKLAALEAMHEVATGGCGD